MIKLIEDEYKQNGDKITTQIGRDDNVPANNRPIGEKSVVKLIYSITRDNLSEIHPGFTAHYKIVKVDKNKFIKSYSANNGDSETHYYSKVQ